MGLGAVAAHVIIFLTMVSAGALLVSTGTGALADGIETQDAHLDRLRAAANERFTLTSVQEQGNRVELTWRNDGSEEILLDDVTLLVDGVVTSHTAANVDVFEVQEDPTSSLWLPGEHLDVWVQKNGGADVDVSIVGPHGVASYRRA